MDRCPRHDTTLIDGDCLVCAAADAQRRAAADDRTGAQAPTRVVDQLGASLQERRAAVAHCLALARQLAGDVHARQVDASRDLAGSADRVCTSCGATLDCAHGTVLELGSAALLAPGVLLKLRQCAACKLIAVVDDAGKSVWMQRKG